MIMEAIEETAATATGAEVLELPALDVLTEPQVRGQACVWDAVPLSGIAAVDLGTRTASRAGRSTHWFPRGCPRCVAEAALRALHAHAPSCEQCVDDAAECPEGLALRRLMRNVRR
jgi:hypothetical protein